MALCSKTSSRLSVWLQKTLGIMLGIRGRQDSRGEEGNSPLPMFAGRREESLRSGKGNPRCCWHWPAKKERRGNHQTQNVMTLGLQNKTGNLCLPRVEMAKLPSSP